MSKIIFFMATFISCYASDFVRNFDVNSEWEGVVSNIDRGDDAAGVSLRFCSKSPEGKSSSDLKQIIESIEKSFEITVELSGSEISKVTISYDDKNLKENTIFVYSSPNDLPDIIIKRSEDEISSYRVNKDLTEIHSMKVDNSVGLDSEEVDQSLKDNVEQ